FFFFQAEDGIRDFHVTGVQTCALPISLIPHMYLHEYMTDEREKREMELHREAFRALGIEWDDDMGVNHHTWRINKNALQTFRNQIGRASCRERVWRSVVSES